MTNSNGLLLLSKFADHNLLIAITIFRLITRGCHRRRTCSHTSPRRSPTMITLHDTRFVECRWWNDGWTVKTAPPPPPPPPPDVCRWVNHHQSKMGGALQPTPIPTIYSRPGSIAATTPGASPQDLDLPPSVHEVKTVIKQK